MVWPPFHRFLLQSLQKRKKPGHRRRQSPGYVMEAYSSEKKKTPGRRAFRWTSQNRINKYTNGQIPSESIKRFLLRNMRFLCFWDNNRTVLSETRKWEQAHFLLSLIFIFLSHSLTIVSVLTTKSPVNSMKRHQIRSKIPGHEKSPEMAYFRAFSTLDASD